VTGKKKEWLTSPWSHHHLKGRNRTAARSGLTLHKPVFRNKEISYCSRTRNLKQCPYPFGNRKEERWYMLLMLVAFSHPAFNKKEMKL
jgi:hypothetical protein